MNLFIYYFFSTILSVFYFFVMLRYIKAWKKISAWEIPSSYKPHTKISIIIPARNEEDNISTCLQSILKNNYPSNLFEIIVIDDFSTDSTAQIVKDFDSPNIKLLQLSDFIKENETLSFKKKAIEIGVQNSKCNLIVTTDADCIVPNQWLDYIVSFYQVKKIKFIAAPVQFYDEQSTFEKFQSLDFLGMMGVTGAGIHGRFMHMCNGANLAYEKKAFEEVEGFKGIDQIASGDDMLLMQKMAKQFPNEIAFLKNKNAATKTKAKSTISSFIQQRIRWASKSTSYAEKQVTFILAMVFFFICNILVSFFLIPFFGWQLFFVFAMQFFVKSLLDFVFLRMMVRFFDRKNLMKYYWSSQVIHIFYIVFVGFMGNIKTKYVWKGREVY